MNYNRKIDIKPEKLYLNFWKKERKERKVKVGILGAGMMVNMLMETIDQLNFSYTAVLGRRESEEKARKLCRDHGLDACFFDYEELLESDVDTIYVALPNHLHSGFAKKALLYGKHVIVEKPATANAAQLKELMEIAKEQKRMLFEAMNIHYLPAYLSLKEALLQVGRPKIVSLNYSQYSSRYDSFRDGQILAAFDPMKAGGAVMDLNVYNVHAVVGLFGRPKRVSYMANVERGIDTSGVLVLDYGDFKVSSIGAKDCKAPVHCTIQGEEGCFVISGPMNQMEGYERILNDGRTVGYQVDKPKNRLYYEFMEFQRMIEEKDWEKEAAMLETSLIVAEILEEARRQNGIFTDFR